MGAQSNFSPGGHAKLGNAIGVGVLTLRFPVDYTTPDGTILKTIEPGHRVRIARSYWKVLVPFTGGTNSAIGASSSTNAAYSTKGDIQGGASGDLAAALTPAGFRGGTAGAKMSGNQAVVLGPGDTIRYDIIAGGFTDGKGYFCVEVVEFDDGTD
jgi:hypothetical protein